jgi:hypothetical protein
MMNMRKLHDDITDVLARGLHYTENVEKVIAMRTAAEVTTAMEGGIDRYTNDPIFRVKVQTLVHQVMEVVRAAASSSGDGNDHLLPKAPK